MGYVNNVDPDDYFDDDWYDNEDNFDSHRHRSSLFGVITFVMAGCLAGFLTTVSFFAYKDELINSLISRQVNLRQVYEDKIITLRNQIDVIASRQLLDQDSFNARIDQMLDRQKLIESETALINMIISQTDFAQSANLNDSDIEALKHKAAKIASDDVNNIALLKDKPDHILKGLENSFADLNQDRFKALGAIEKQLNHSIASLSQAIEGVGIKAQTVMKSSHKQNVGGPFIPLKGSTITNDFEDKLVTLREKYQDSRALKYSLQRLPIHRPVGSRNRLSSNFGKRKDPFNGKLSQHNGVDYRGRTGDAIRASGSGKVIRAGRAGGYGKLIEIQHDYGFKTRYAHLSKILVKRGDVVKTGDIIGKLGSTGRSTGPHLHFEVRKRNKAVNPTPYLKIGRQVSGLLD